MARNIYVIDTASLIRIKPEDYPHDIYVGQWSNIENIVKEGRLVSSKIVFEELGKRSDDIYEWAKRNRSMFREITLQQTRLVKQIFNTDNFRALIDSNATEGQADPFIIAIALEKEKRQSSLFDSNEEIKKIVVTEETINPKHPNKIRIPFVCQHFGIECITLFDFFRREGWKW
ncbi:MAG: hypothetical protein A7315_11110 [Candidatus Altiarchaeales archaeon WOR_SM1_79]|nr:MAG: hypothetical protein A7315_11110 [Candidatus Altiarchaeales archaeon WOR_SM1_79]